MVLSLRCRWLVFTDDDTYAGREVCLRTIAVQAQHQVLLVAATCPRDGAPR